jgi:hypothetical protein
MKSSKIDPFRLISDISAYLYLLILLLGNIFLGAKKFLENPYLIYASLALILTAVFLGLINKPVRQLPSALLARSAGGLIAISLLSVEYFFVFQRLKTSILVVSAIFLSSFLISLLMIYPRKIGSSIKYLLFLAGIVLTAFGGLAQVFMEKIISQPVGLGYYGLIVTIIGLVFLAFLIFREKK